MVNRELKQGWFRRRRMRHLKMQLDYSVSFALQNMNYMLDNKNIIGSFSHRKNKKVTSLDN